MDAVDATAIYWLVWQLIDPSLPAKSEMNEQGTFLEMKLRKTT